jgi:endogenous inhibitor of DNA gyrase (YacG/DUF329 family)
MSMGSKRRAEPRCPICRRRLPTTDEGPEVGPKFAPMCSLRCKRIDLATWLGEGYRIAGDEAHDDDAKDTRTGDEP